MRRAGIVCWLVAFSCPAISMGDREAEGAESASEALSVDVAARPGGKWMSRQTPTLRDLPDFTPSSGPALSQYGGRADRKLEATGFFRVQRSGEHWSLVDPEGCLFLSIGLCSVNRQSSEASTRPAEDDVTLQPWVEQTADLLRSNGFNTLGCWSSWEQFRGQPRPIPYTTQWNFLRRFAARSGRIVSPARDPDSPGPLVVLFDPGFEAFCDEHARQLAATRDDPWLLGHFSDNELPFQVNLLEEFLQLPGDHSAHRMAEVWLAGRRSGKPLRGVSIGDREAFREHVVRHYFRIVSEAIRKHDPNHLFLGSRFHGRALRQEAVFRGCARLVDVVSVNYYHAWTPSRQQTQRWVSESGRPFLVTEWYAKGMDRGLLNKGGAGWVVRTQEDRGRFYQHFVLGLLRDPACVGWHWFRYQDNGAARDGGTSNKGLVDLEYKPYAALEAAMRELNTQAYHLSDHLQQDALPAGQEGGAE